MNYMVKIKKAVKKVVNKVKKRDKFTVIAGVTTLEDIANDVGCEFIAGVTTVQDVARSAKVDIAENASIEELAEKL